jgi:tripartite-type tricarboxylate transporter receptor subunit TctC
MFKAMAGVDLIHVPYKGDAPEIVDLLGGHLDLAFVALTPIAPHVKAGKLRALAVTGAQRTPVMPDLPTIEEAGGLKGYDISTWWGLLAPAGTPPAIVNRLSATMAKIVALPDIKERFAALGIEPAAITPEQFATLIKALPILIPIELAV